MKPKFFRTQERFRKWLRENHDKRDELVVGYYKVKSGKRSMTWPESVDQALCFGWIDSIIKKLGEEQNVQRFSPRKPKSDYSQTNKERLKRLIKQGKVIPEVLESLADVDLDKFDYPVDIITSIRENKLAWVNLQKYSESYRRIRIAYIDEGRKRPGEYEKRLQNFIQKTAKDKQFGYGIEDYY